MSVDWRYGQLATYCGWTTLHQLVSSLSTTHRVSSIPTGAGLRILWSAPCLILIWGGEDPGTQIRGCGIVCAIENSARHGRGAFPRSPSGSARTLFGVALRGNKETKIQTSWSEIPRTHFRGGGEAADFD